MSNKIAQSKRKPRKYYGLSQAKCATARRKLWPRFSFFHDFHASESLARVALQKTIRDDFGLTDSQFNVFMAAAMADKLRDGRAFTYTHIKQIMPTVKKNTIKAALRQLKNKGYLDTNADKKRMTMAQKGIRIQMKYSRLATAYFNRLFDMKST